MAVIVSTNITSPLGMTTEETYRAVRSGRSGLSSYPCRENGEGWKGLPFDIQASLFSGEQWQTMQTAGMTRFESAVLHSVRDAMAGVEIDLGSAIFILSSTKGDVENLDEGRDVPALGDVARKISRAVGIENDPIVVCNACISGVSALILAQRLIDSGCYKHAIVCGADVQSRFIVSGFQSFKALSPEPCRPFDIERLGLNLGEAAATVVLTTPVSTADGTEPDRSRWSITEGAVRNDAYHISAPHPRGTGACLALQGIDTKNLAVLGVHGTATMYNDQMESKAIESAGLLDVPLSALKGYFGHTMGAAGILETILTARALDDGIILPSRGYSMRGVSGKVTLSDKETTTDRRSFIKMLSGFGGCNGAIRVAKGQQAESQRYSFLANTELEALHSVRITSEKVTIDGKELHVEHRGKEMLTEVYKAKVRNYPKFYKMDMLSRLAFIATELLIGSEKYYSEAAEQCIALAAEACMEEDERRAVVLFNRTSSIIADRQYEKSISNKSEFFPSPAAFVYTLPNITTGEIAIRNDYHGETSFYILPERNEQLMMQVLHTTFADRKTKSIIGGWIDCPSDNEFECEIKIYQQVVNQNCFYNGNLN